MAKKRRAGELLRFNVTIPLWFVLVAAVAALLVTYFVSPAYQDNVKFITLLVGGAAAIYSAYYVGAALRLRLETEKKNNSFELLSLLNRPEFVQVRQFIEKAVKHHKDISQSALYKRIMEDEKLLNAVTVVLGIMEDMSIAIQHDYVDEGILYQSLNVVVKLNFSPLRPYIEQCREEDKNDTTYKELQKLATAWENGNRLSDGRALPTL